MGLVIAVYQLLINTILITHKRDFSQLGKYIQNTEQNLNHFSHKTL